MNRPKLVIFDMDGLLLDSEIVGYRAHLDVAPRWGIDFRREHYEALIGQNVPGAARTMQANFPDLDIPAYRDEVMANRARIVAEAPIPLKPGVHEILDTLDALGIPMVVCSSSSRATARHELGRHGIWERFVGGVFGDEVTHSKPHPQIVLRALALTDCAPDDAWVLEDSYNGIRAAIAANVPVIMIPDMLPPHPELPVMAVYKTLRELARELQQDS